MDNKKTLTISIENFYGENKFFEELKMPAKANEIKDALHRARIFDGVETEKQLIISDCPLLPEIEHHYLDSPTIEELNFLAKRLCSLSEEERAILKAVKGRYTGQREDGLISIKDMINLTYELDNVSVISNVGDLKALGEFVVENGLNEDISAIPETSLYLLDKTQIGKLQCENDNGIFVNGNYYVTDDYKLKEIYDGKTLLEQPDNADYVFRLEIAKCPQESVSEVEDDAVWINLPIDYKEADMIAQSLGEKSIVNCVYLGFESIIPQIQAEHFDEMSKFIELNKLAGAIQNLSGIEQAKFKAVLDSTQITDIKAMNEIIQHLNEFSYGPYIDGAGNYFKNYLDTYLDKGFDRAWLDTLLLKNEGQELMQRLGVKNTDYGFISANGHTLYEYVKRYGNSIKLSEKFELIEVCGQTALFTNERIDCDNLPDGLFRYDLREGENGRFCTIENKVFANHGGSVITKEPIDLGDKGYVQFTEETSPNFLGEEITLREFLETDFTQTNQENNSIGDIKQ